MDHRKVFEKMAEKSKTFFIPKVCCLIQKLDQNSGLHVKSQREISNNKVGRLLWPLEGENAEKGREMVKREAEIHYRAQN